jgi:hypothetical protein
MALISRAPAGLQLLSIEQPLPSASVIVGMMKMIPLAILAITAGLFPGPEAAQQATPKALASGRAPLL